MKKITHLLRIKKFRPYFELYEVKNNTLYHLNNSNELIKIDIYSPFLRIILSSSLCVEGERSFDIRETNIKIHENQFYFNHQIISNERDLFYSNAKKIKNKVKQLWMNIDEYNKLVLPIIEKYKYNIESIISEKSSFIINKGQSIKFFDNKILNTLKLNLEGFTEITSSVKTEQTNDKSCEGLMLSYNINDIPNLKPSFTKLNYFAYGALILIFCAINIGIFYISSNPGYSLMINYFISDAKIYKIENPNKIIEAEKKINLKIKEEIPQKFNFFNEYINKFSNTVLSKLIETKINQDGKIILKFQSNAMKEILFFKNDNQDLDVSIEAFDDFILLIRENE